MKKGDECLMLIKIAMTDRISTTKYNPKKEQKRLLDKKRELAKRMKDPKIQAKLKQRHEEWGEQ